MKRKVYSFNSELFKVTGVQKVLMDVHHAVMDEYDAKIVGTVPFEKVHKDLDIHKEKYVKFCNPFMFRNSIVILHERKFLAFFWLLNHVFFQNIKLVYIHHNVFSNHRRMSVMPNTVVAISDEGVRNLYEFFDVPMENIHKIYNCVRDIHPKPHKVYDGGVVKILYPARINGQKRQLEVIEHLKGKLSDKVKILFAGTGPNLEALKEATKGDGHFECLGYRSDIYDLLQECDYMMLFSGHEGLPISLIEADMIGIPIICSNVGGNGEIVKNDISGYVLDKGDWEGLHSLINSLSEQPTLKYKEMCTTARKIFVQYFGFDKFKTKYLNLLNSL
ncbi:glycosyltransferase family 4 protein [Segatella copri]|uniref:glycosyltransferase family 4 protein n=1 Tax=Segatella copri TaxID=165179 RepID=UPI003F8CC37E